MNLPGYDAWKTRGPDWDDTPTCDRCGSHLTLRGGWGCDVCSTEEHEDNAMVDFYQWEPL